MKAGEALNQALRGFARIGGGIEQADARLNAVEFRLKRMSLQRTAVAHLSGHLVDAMSYLSARSINFSAIPRRPILFQPIHDCLCTKLEILGILAT
jgi:prephenate dehydratase